MYETTEYASFINYPSNRQIKTAKVDRLMDSMRLTHLMTPILVNEDLFIIDGQHRHAAVTRLKLPLYFVVKEGLTAADIPVYNTNATNWKPENYLDSYAAEGFHSYVYLKDYMERYDMTLNAAIRFLTGEYNIDTEAFQLGDFEIPVTNQYDPSEIKVARFQEIRQAFKNNIEGSDKYVDSRGFTKVFMRLLSDANAANYDHASFLARIDHDGKKTLDKLFDKLGTGKMKQNYEETFNTIVAIYNYDRRKGSVEFV